MRTGGNTARGNREKNFSQLSTMRPFTTYDQDGRAWFFEQSIRSGMPCGPFQPKFVAPWYPNHKYFIVNFENPSEMYIDYPTMRSDKRQALARFHRQAVEYATDKGLPVPALGEKYSKEILGKLGTAPDSILPIIAAEQGNPWILGRTTVVDPRLVEHIKSNRRTISVDEEGFDFGEESFTEATANAPVRRATSLKDLPRVTGVEVDTDSPAVGEAVAGGEDDDDLGGVPAQAVDGHLPPLVDESEADAAFDGERLEELVDLEEQHDQQAVGGHKFRPNHRSRMARQAPRVTPTVAGAGVKKGEAKGKKKRSLAEGARPIVSALEDE